MKTRIRISQYGRDTEYVPEYKWLFWWRNITSGGYLVRCHSVAEAQMKLELFRNRYIVTPDPEPQSPSMPDWRNER